MKFFYSPSESIFYSTPNQSAKMKSSYIDKFYEISFPTPGIFYPTQVDTKAHLKLILEIATHSRLKQGQDKKEQNLQVFYCKAKGKNCFRILVDFTHKNEYKIITDYNKVKHQSNCEFTGQSAKTLQLYNLMMLKKDLLQTFMEKNELVNYSPENILQIISDSQEYFYCSIIKEVENRRKLKKRFDNIVNICIKKKKNDKTSIENSSCPSKKTPKKSKKKAKKEKKQSTSKQNIIDQQKSEKYPLPIITLKEPEGEKKEWALSIFDMNYADHWISQSFSESSQNYYSCPKFIDMEDDLFLSVQDDENVLNKSLEKKSLLQIQPKIQNLNDSD